MTPAPLSLAVVRGDHGDADPSYRQPPGNVEVEMALLGAILVDNRAYERVSEFLKPEHFLLPAHGAIFTAAAKMIERGQQAVPATLKQFLAEDVHIAEMGGVRYLAELAATALNVIDVESYGRTIHDMHLRRELIQLGQDVVNEAYTHEIELPAIAQIESAEHRLFELAGNGASEGGFKSFDRTLANTIRMAEAAFRREGRLTGLTTGLIRLDELMGGLQPSDLLILAGRPGMGKTSLATNIAFNAAKAERIEQDSQGRSIAGPPHVIAFFSLEMSAEQLALRVLGEQAEIPSDHIRRGKIDNDQFGKIAMTSRQIADLRLFIDDTPALSISALRTRARRLLRTQGRLDLVVIDYLQLMRASANSKPENRVQEISEITRGLKALAKELNVPVLALSQLSRAVEQREDKRPQLADLRESGSIEQDADVVLFVYRAEYYLGRQEPEQATFNDLTKFNEAHDKWKQDMDAVHNRAEVIIAKQRHGPTDRVELSFQGEFTKFGNLDTIHRPSDAPF